MGRTRRAWLLPPLLLLLLVLPWAAGAARAQQAAPKPKAGTAPPQAPKAKRPAVDGGRDLGERWLYERIRTYSGPDAPELRRLAAAGALTRVKVSDAVQARVPQSYLGLSLDLNDIEGVSHPDFVGFVRELTQFDTGPMLIRVGAYSADRLTKPWPATVYRALTALAKATGSRFIVGVSQHSEDPDVTREQVRRTLKLLPAGSVVSFAVGNEPDLYALPPKNGLPGSLNPKSKEWLNTQWISTARQLFAAAAEVTPVPRMLAGPDWSDPNIRVDKLQWWLNSVHEHLNMVTVHLYGGDVINDKHIGTIVADKRMLQKLQNLRALVKSARGTGGLPVRITEAATISYGGVQGISDTAGAAIWALDVAMEAAYQGVAGIHFHQVLKRFSNANYNAIDVNIATNRVRARNPLWGYVMLQEALEGGADIVGRAISGECKVWTLKGRKDGSLRVLVINKASGGKQCAADVKLSGEQAARYAAKGLAHYLWAKGGLEDRWRVYFSNTYFDQWGSDRKAREVLVPVPRYEVKGPGGRPAGAGFAVHLTNGTLAALLTVPKASAAAGAKGGRQR